MASGWPAGRPGAQSLPTSFRVVGGSDGTGTNRVTRGLPPVPWWRAWCSEDGTRLAPAVKGSIHLPQFGKPAMTQPLDDVHACHCPLCRTAELERRAAERR